MHIRKFTPSERRRIFDLGRQSLFFYCRSILGFSDLADPASGTTLHWDYCRFLESPAKRKLVFIFRGGFKSTIGTIGYASWKSIYQPNHMTKLVEASSDNAFRNHFFPIYYIFVESHRADFLSWLYGDRSESGLSRDADPDADMRRIPEGFKGWNANQLDFIRTDPLALPSITYGGINTTYEGWHGNLVLGDDLEGSDEDRTDVSSEDAWRFVDERATPLLRRAKDDFIHVIGTPHGSDPVIHKIRDREMASRAAGNPPIWSIFWEPLINTAGRCIWPEGFDAQAIATLKMSKRMWATQYMGERSSGESRIFDVDAIRSNTYTWAIPNRLISYSRARFARTPDGRDIHDADGYQKIVHEPSTINAAYLRTFIHCDPKHEESPQYSDAEAAIVVTGCSWDQHVFKLDSWTGDVGLEEFTEELYFRYRKYAPWRVTMGAVAAEKWFWPWARMLEKGKYKRLLAIGSGAVLPALTSRLDPAAHSTQIGKDDWIVRQLEPWFSFGAIHLAQDDEAFFSQLRQCGEPGGRRDLIDALAQGPDVWSFPRPKEAVEGERTLASRQALLGPRHPHTGYYNPYRRPGQVPGDLQPTHLIPERF